MTGDDSMDPTSLDMSSLTASRLRALLLAALESETEDGMHWEIAAGASQMLSALGRRVGAPGEGLLEEAMAPTTSVPELVRIKEAAKVLLSKAERREDREAAVLLYLVAVAAARAPAWLAVSQKPGGGPRAGLRAPATRPPGVRARGPVS